MLKWVPARVRKFILGSDYNNNNKDGRKVLYEQVKEQGSVSNRNHKDHLDNLSKTAETSPHCGNRTSQIDQIVSQASLIYYEVSSFNRAVASNKESQENSVLKQNLKLVKFLDNLFIAASLTSVGVAVLVEVYL